MILGIKQPVLLFDAVKKKEGSDMRKYKKTLALCLAALLALEFSGGSTQALTALAQPAESGAAPERKMVSGSQMQCGRLPVPTLESRRQPQKNRMWLGRRLLRL